MDDLTFVPAVGIFYYSAYDMQISLTLWEWLDDENHYFHVTATKSMYTDTLWTKYMNVDGSTALPAEPPPPPPPHTHTHTHS